MLFERVKGLDVFKNELVLDDYVKDDQARTVWRKVYAVLIVLIFAEK